MRRLALGFAFLWLAFAFGVRLYDMRTPQIYISTLTGGQLRERATLAWLQGGVPWHQEPGRALMNRTQGRGRLVVVDTRIDGKVLRYASATLPPDWLDCRLWLEEGPETVQAVASCPGHQPVRLTASGQSVLGLGPDSRPPVLRELQPLTSVEPDRIVNKIHRKESAPMHPSLLLLGLLAMAPLGVGAWRNARRLRKLQGTATLEGVMEQTDKGALTIRAGERRVRVFVEDGEVISVGLGRAARLSDSMAVEGLRASVKGEVEHQTEGAFRGGETMRLKPGAMLVVGDLLGEARQQLRGAVATDVAFAAMGALVAGIVALGLGF